MKISYLFHFLFLAPFLAGCGSENVTLQPPQLISATGAAAPTERPTGANTSTSSSQTAHLPLERGTATPTALLGATTNTVRTSASSSSSSTYTAHPSSNVETSSTLPEYGSLLVSPRLEEQQYPHSAKYGHLLDTVERIMFIVKEEYKEYMKLLESLLDRKENTTYRVSPQQILALSDAVRARMSFIATLHDHTVELLKGTRNVNYYLHDLLVHRFDYLKNRDINIKRTLGIYKKDDGISPNILPASKTLFEHFMQDEGYKGLSEINDFFRLNSISRFETLNLLIVETFQSASTSEFSTETISLLDKAVQLHPMLRGERQDLGHPDEACGVYGLLENIINQQPGHLVIREYKQALRRLGPTSSQLFPRRMAAAQLYLRVIENPDFKEYINQIRRNCDLDVYEGHTLAKVFFPVTLRSRLCGTRGIPGFYAKGTPYGFGIWPHKIPCFVPKKTKPGMPESPISTATSALTTETSPSSSSSSASSTDSPKEMAIATPILSSSSSASSSISSSASLSKEAVREACVSSSSSSASSSTYSTTNVPTRTPAPSSSTRRSESTEAKVERRLIRACEVPFVINYQLPKGLRRTLNMAKASNPIQILSSTHQKVVDRLFNHEQAIKVRFLDFESAWQAAGGLAPRPGGGGSHVRLYWDEKYLFTMVIPHGKSKSDGFGYQNIAYSQAAFLWVGVLPTEAMDE